MSYTVHNRCRACGWGPAFDPGGTKTAANSQRLESVLNLGIMPLPNAFKKSGEPRPGYYPLELMACPQCTLGQLSAVVDPVEIYSHYAYVTSTSQMMARHLAALWQAFNRYRTIETVVEIGANDGLCLEYFKGFGAHHVLGIDPAKNLVEKAVKRGVNSLYSMFDRQAAEMAVSSLPPIDLVLARHVFCHVNDWPEFINNVGVLCQKNTVVCIEVPHAHDLIARCEWDTVYAEHTSYMTIKAMLTLLEGSALKLQQILHFPVHGGVLAMILRRRDCDVSVMPEVQQRLELEKCSLEDWRHFADRARDQINSLSILVRDLVADHKRVVGYGASAKSTMWVNACKLTRREIEAIYDCTPEKQYTTSPGSDIPIRHEGAFFADAADYAVMWCWNYQQEVLEKNQNWLDGGGRFIIPVPALQIIGKNGKSLA